MTLPTVFAFILVSLVSYRLGARGAGRAAAGFGAILVLAIGSGWAPKMALDWLQQTPQQTTPKWQDRNAIVVFGLGTNKWPGSARQTTHALGFSRLYETARLYLDCKRSGASACAVFASGGDPRGKGVSEAAVMAREMAEIGVAQADIVVEADSRNTFENAANVAALLRAKGFTNVVAVTSGAHLRRALLYLAHFGVLAVGAPSDRLEPSISWVPLAHNFSFMDIAVHELAGFARYRAFQSLGWNSTPAGAGAP